MLALFLFLLQVSVVKTIAAKATAYPVPGTVLDRANPRPKEPFLFKPYAPTFEERRVAALRYVADHWQGSQIAAIAKVLLGEKPEPIKDATIDYFESHLNAREDCADFTAMDAVVTVTVNNIKPILTPAQAERIKKALTGFKYWIDEPGPDTMISWTENHQMMFHASEYLAGQNYPNEIFTNNKQTGAWHKEHARKMILQWMDRRARWGFSEWDSNVYYSEDLSAVLSLAQYAKDKDVATAAAIVSDLMLFDIASDLFHGIYGTSHGRAYDQDILNGRDHSVVSIISIVTGLGVFSGADGDTALSLCAKLQYTPSDIITEMALDNPAEFTNLERHGIPLDKIEQFGISPKRLEDAPTLWGMGAHTQAEVVDLFVKAADAYRLWQHPFFDIAGDMPKMLPRNGSLGKMRKDWEIESDRTLLGEVNKITYRTPDYQLSAAQSYRPGERGNQHHIWQATLSPDAEVFTTNPGSLSINDDRTPDYFAGQNRLPRVAQYKNLAIILYDIKMKKAIGERDVYDFTHAFFPKWAFDEVAESDGWIFGRVADGYVALHSALPYEWKNPQDPFVHDAVSKGIKNIWICQMGNKAKDGSFESFRAAILKAELKLNVETLEIQFKAPGIGNVSFSWTGPLLVDGKDIQLKDYPRVDNPYCKSEFNSGVYTIERNGEKLILDMPNLKRTIIPAGGGK